MKRGKCRGCGAEILWIETASGKSMPCDPDPVKYWEKSKAAGKATRPDGVTVSCEYEGDLDKATGIGYISHFSTCPQAKNFKRK